MILPSDKELDSENINLGMVYREKEGFQNTLTQKKTATNCFFFIIPCTGKKMWRNPPWSLKPKMRFCEDTVNIQPWALQVRKWTWHSFISPPLLFCLVLFLFLDDSDFIFIQPKRKKYKICREEHETKIANKLKLKFKKT